MAERQLREGRVSMPILNSSDAREVLFPVDSQQEGMLYGSQTK